VLHFLTAALYCVSELDIERYIAMTNSNDTNRILADAAEQIRREAFAAGWKAAIAAMNKAAAELVDPEMQDDMDIAATKAAPASLTSAGDPKTGSTPWYVLQAIRKKHGMTGSEVVSVVQESGHRVSEASIRTSLVRLERKKLIIGRHRKWFPQGA
jgi:hypothetical protein